MNEIQPIQSQLEDETLDLIDNADEFTRSDLQGMVSVIIRRAMQAGKDA